MTIVKRDRRVIESNCPYHYSFRYGVATGEKSPCTNVPIHCTHCDSGSRKLTIWKYNAFNHIQTTHPTLISHGLDKALRLDIQITCREEKKMELTSESIKGFRAAKRSLLLGDTELSSLKSEVEAEASRSKGLKKRGQNALDTPSISATPAKKKKGKSGDTDILVFPAKRKTASEDSAISSSPMKKAKGS